MPVLRLGSRGESVKELQRLLNTKGYSLVVDGSFGNGTRSAVLDYQRKNKLSVDGIVGNQTWTSLRSSGTSNTTPTISGAKGYKKLRMFNSDVHVYEIRDDEKPKFTFGVRGKLERVSNVVRNEGAVAGINGGFFNFNGSSEHLGMVVVDGKWYTSPSNNFLDFIIWKNGKVTIENLHGYDATKLNQFQRDAEFAIGTSYGLIRDGKIDTENRNKFAHSNQRHPRTLLGQHKDGHIIYVVVDGRTLGNSGVAAIESQRIMTSLGCINAVNLDGGGSSTMVVNGRVVNKPSGGTERAVGSILLVVKK
jgi:exopolysaccharide biosynthesis protein